MKKEKVEKIVTLIFFIIIFSITFYFNIEKQNVEKNNISNKEISYEINNIPTYSGEIYVTVNNNIPKFSEEDMQKTEDYYSNLKYGRARSSYNKN